MKLKSVGPEELAFWRAVSARGIEALYWLVRLPGIEYLKGLAYWRDLDGQLWPVQEDPEPGGSYYVD